MNDTSLNVSNRIPFSAAVSDAWVIALRNIRHVVRTPQLIVFSVVQTVMFLLLFRYVFGGSIVIPGMSFVDYLISGLSRADRDLRRLRCRDLHGRGLEVRLDRPLPGAADGALRGREWSCRRRPAAPGGVAAHRAGRRLSRRLPAQRQLRRPPRRARAVHGVGLRALLGVRRDRALRPRHRDRAGRDHAVLRAGLHLLVPDPRRHPARLAAADRPEPAAQPGRERGAGPDGRRAPVPRSSSTAPGTTSSLRCSGARRSSRCSRRSPSAPTGGRSATTPGSTATRGCPSSPARPRGRRRAWRAPGACRRHAYRGRGRARSWPGRP